jgi:hypothetical protein
MPLNRKSAGGERKLEEDVSTAKDLARFDQLTLGLFGSKVGRDIDFNTETSCEVVESGSAGPEICQLVKLKKIFETDIPKDQG